MPVFKCQIVFWNRDLEKSIQNCKFSVTAQWNLVGEAYIFLNSLLRCNEMINTKTVVSPTVNFLFLICKKNRKITHRYSDTSAQVVSTPECTASSKQRSESFPNPNTQKYNSAPNPESSTPSCPYTGAISKLTDPIGTTSQDSGINMYFHDQDDSRLRTIVEVSSNERFCLWIFVWKFYGKNTSTNVFSISECEHCPDNQLYQKVLTALNRIHAVRHRINANVLRSITIILCDRQTNTRKMIRPIRTKMIATNGIIYRIRCGNKLLRLQNTLNV